MHQWSGQPGRGGSETEGGPELPWAMGRLRLACVLSHPETGRVFVVDGDTRYHNHHVLSGRISRGLPSGKTGDGVSGLLRNADCQGGEITMARSFGAFT